MGIGQEEGTYLIDEDKRSVKWPGCKEWFGGRWDGPAVSSGPDVKWPGNGEAGN